jgi:hypothetical protein
MPARDKEPAVIGHNEETFEFFTKLAKYKKRQVQIQDQLIQERNIDVNDLTAMHQAIRDSEVIAKQEYGL